MAEEIVDRLKAEGQLIRNTGTNSIRAVRIQLDRFEGIFETISENISAQTQMLESILDVSADQLKMSEETAERGEARRQREELAEDQTPTPRPDTTREDLPNKKTRESRGLFDLLRGGINLSKLLLGGAAAVSGGIFAYNFLKGFIDEKTGGGFTRFEEGLIDTIQNVDFSAIKEGFISLTTSLETIAELVSRLSNTIQAIIDNPLLLFGGATAGGFALGRGLSRLTAPPGQGPTRERASIRSRLSSVRGNILTAVSLLALAYGDEAKKFLEEQAGVPAEFADPAVDAASMALYGATILSMFGPKGMLVGAIAGIAVSLGLNAMNWFDRRKAEAEEQLRKDLAEAETILNDSEARAEIESTRDTLKTMTPEEQEAFIDSRGGFTRAEQLAFEKVTTKKDYDTAEITRLLSEIKRFNQMGTIVPSTHIQELRSLGYDTKNLENDTGYKLPEYKRGTKGFQDFGNASFAILHGREAVVPEETPAGRFLNQFFTDNWLPKMAPSSDLADRVATAAGGSINMPVIVNNSPTVAPIVNNVQGGPNVTSTNVFGSGGSRSGTFGLSNAIN